MAYSRLRLVLLVANVFNALYLLLSNLHPSLSIPCPVVPQFRSCLNPIICFRSHYDPLMSLGSGFYLPFFLSISFIHRLTILDSISSPLFDLVSMSVSAYNLLLTYVLIDLCQTHYIILALSPGSRLVSPDFRYVQVFWRTKPL